MGLKKMERNRICYGCGETLTSVSPILGKAGIFYCPACKKEFIVLE